MSENAVCPKCSGRFVFNLSDGKIIDALCVACGFRIGESTEGDGYWQLIVTADFINSRNISYALDALKELANRYPDTYKVEGSSLYVLLPKPA